MTPAALDAPSFADTLARALDAGDVAAVQLRHNNLDDNAIRQAVKILRPVAQDRGVAFLLNDKPALAAETGCDGVHIGQQDASVAEARAAVGADGIVFLLGRQTQTLPIKFWSDINMQIDPLLSAASTVIVCIVTVVILGGQIMRRRQRSAPSAMPTAAAR